MSTLRTATHHGAHMGRRSSGAAAEGRFGRLQSVNLACAIILTLGMVGARDAAAAGPWNPDTRWVTIRTPHFDVVHPAGYDALGLRTAHIGEALYPYLALRYRWSPPRITVILDDQTDFANGSARLLPNRVVVLFVTAPIRTSGLEDYDDWLYTVLDHELAHVFHIDMAYGLAGIGRALLGQYVTMNGYAAAWSVEGLAVYEETVSSGAGRGRSTYVDMILRTAALEDRFPGIDQGYRAYPRWPFGNLSYFFGGRFQRWLAERYGEDTLLDYHRAYAANPVPYVSVLPARTNFGASLEALWLGFEKETREDAQHLAAQIRAQRPAHEPRPVQWTFHGGQSVGPRVTPDGKSVVFSASSPVDGPRIRRIPIGGGPEEVLLNDTLSQAVGFTPEGDGFYYQQTEINQRFYQHNQLRRFDMKTRSNQAVSVVESHRGRFVAPSGALRARDPDVSPDGRKLVFVQTHRAMNRLILADLDDTGLIITPQVLLRGEPDVQLASPRFAPDGQHIALSRFAGGRRDVVWVDLDGSLAEITRDRAQDVDPSWSPDGRWLVFASDRSGVYDLYALDTWQGVLRRLTHLVTGAFQPSISPDGQTLVFRGYTSAGFDVFGMPFRPNAAPVVSRDWEGPAEQDRRARQLPLPNALAPAPPPPVRETSIDRLPALPDGWARTGYDPLRTLLPSRSNWNLLPAVSANEREVLASVSFFGQDALQTHSYALTARYGSFTNFFGGRLQYTNDVLEPTFTVFANADAVTFARALFTDASGPCPFGGNVSASDGTSLCFGTEGGLYVERRLSVGGSIGLPLLQRHFLTVGYTFEERAPLDALPAGTDVRFLPRAGNYARVTLGYRYANVRRFPYSVSLERGHSFSAALSALAGGVGSDFEQILFNADWRGYKEFFRNHVLALRLTLGLGGGPDLAERFRLGGASGTSVLSSTTRNFFPLRGLQPAVLSGTGQVSGTFEYRAPLLRVDRGLGTFPFTLSVLHAALFFDAGRVFEGFDILPADDLSFATSVGAELRADARVAFVAPLTLRLGFAWPLSLPPGLSRGEDVQNLYFQLGSAF